MAVSISKPAINLREELTRLKSPVIIKPQRFQTFWFENLVTNGTFDTDSDWTKGTGWTISGGTASKSTGSQGTLDGIVDAVTPEYLSLSYTISGVSGGIIQPFLAGTEGTSQNSNGTFTEALIFGTGTSYDLRFVANSVFDGDIDNVSLYEADPSDDAPWYRMPLGWKPFQVFEDGSLIREGSTHDYEVIFDGYTYFVKPSVAPGVSTETQIVGVAT